MAEADTREKAAAEALKAAEEKGAKLKAKEKEAEEEVQKQDTEVASAGQKADQVRDTSQHSPI